MVSALLVVLLPMVSVSGCGVGCCDWVVFEMSELWTSVIVVVEFSAHETISAISIPKKAM